MMSEQEMFRKTLRLQGRRVAVGLIQGGEQLRGRIVNTMFDSLLLETVSRRRVIRFRDIFYLDECDR